MASDSQATMGNTTYTTQKIYRVGDSLVGFTGHVDCIASFLEWFEAKVPPGERKASDYPEFDEGFGAVVLDRSGIHLYEQKGGPIECLDQFFADGSGGAVAMGAILLGKSPREAVLLACEVDAWSGTPVVVEKL